MTFLDKKTYKRLLYKLKLLFSKKKSEQITDKKQIEVKPIVNDVPYSQEQKEIFDQLQVGDLVYARMHLSDEELEKVPEGHRTRPYYVAAKYKDYLEVCQCSSTQRISNNEFSYYVLSDYSYEELTKESFLDLKYIHKLPIEYLIKYLGHVNEHDFNEINKRMYKNNKKAFVKRYGDSDKYKKPSSGDIIMLNGYHLLVVSDIGEYYRVLRIRPKDNGKGEGFYLKVGNTSWKILKIDGYGRFIEKKKSSKIYHTINKGEFIKIKNYLNSIGGTNCIPKGYIFRIEGNKYFYSYGSYNDKTQAYYVYKGEKKDNCNFLEYEGSVYSIDERKQTVISDFSSVDIVIRCH